MYTHPNWNALELPMQSSSEYFVSPKVVEGWFQQGGCSPVWFLRDNDFEYVWHKNEKFRDSGWGEGDPQGEGYKW